MQEIPNSFLRKFNYVGKREIAFNLFFCGVVFKFKLEYQSPTGQTEILSKTESFALQTNYLLMKYPDNDIIMIPKEPYGLLLQLLLVKFKTAEM